MFAGFVISVLRKELADQVAGVQACNRMNCGWCVTHTDIRHAPVLFPPGSHGGLLCIVHIAGTISKRVHSTYTW